MYFDSIAESLGILKFCFLLVDFKNTYKVTVSPVFVEEYDNVT